MLGLLEAREKKVREEAERVRAAPATAERASARLAEVLTETPAPAAEDRQAALPGRRISGV